ncbi:hypothetical protein BLOT_015840 [Blomia tropicalis]|nr:hypothetical protein BLOT_016698 [Blomia tropicalis]KAI2796286.1 hypothetical protein BLOT_015840 [Blomia tropicalis]
MHIRLIPIDSSRRILSNNRTFDQFTKVELKKKKKHFYICQIFYNNRQPETLKAYQPDKSYFFTD